jgi:hypothetical protein
MGLQRCETRAQLALEQSDGARDTRLDSVGIAVQRRASCLGEVCRDYTECA